MDITDALNIPGDGRPPGATPPDTEPAHEPGAIRRVLAAVGPGVVTGASDDDPSGIGTYAAAGASLGYATLWTALLTFPLMAAVQYVCAKIGLVSGRGLAGVLRRHYPRWLLYPAVAGLVATNTLNVGADIGAVAAGVNLLVPVNPAWLIFPIGLLILVLQVWGSYRLIAGTFKWLCLSLSAYVGAALLARPDWSEVARGTLLPAFRSDAPYLQTLVAILGTTISPYLFFWQASQEVEEEKALGRRQVRDRHGATEAELRYAGWDTGVGMLFSNVVMYFIILATAATLHRTGQTEIADAAQAAEALRPLAGDAATVLMALGLVGTGLLAIPILTGSAAFASAEAFGWRHGLDEQPGRARPFYGVMAASTVVGLLLNYLGVNPISALVWTAVVNGFLAPPLLVVVMLAANNKAVMGTRVNGRALNVLGWATAALMFIAAGGSGVRVRSIAHSLRGRAGVAGGGALASRAGAAPAGSWDPGRAHPWRLGGRRKEGTGGRGRPGQPGRATCPGRPSCAGTLIAHPCPSRSTIPDIPCPAGPARADHTRDATGEKPPCHEARVVAVIKL